MTRIVFSALLSHWRRAPLQLFTLLVGLALATALWSGVQALNAEARASYQAAADALGENQFAQLSRANGTAIQQDTYVHLRRSGWPVSPVVEGRINGARLIGLDPLSTPASLGPLNIANGDDIAAYFSGRARVYGQQETLDLVDGQIDADLIFRPDTAPNTLLADIGIAQILLNRPDELDRMLLVDEPSLAASPLAELAPDLVITEPQGGSDVQALTDSFHLNLTAFGLLSFAVGIFIVNGAVGLAFEQRRPVVRTLRALGVPLRLLLVSMAVELFLFALLAGCLGVVIGYFIASVLLPDVAATLRGLYGADVSGSLQLRAEWWATGLLIALVGTAIAAADAFYRISKVPILATASTRAIAMVSIRSRRQSLFAAGLLGVSALLATQVDGVLGGFAVLATLLIGAAIGLPPLLNAFLSLAERWVARPMPQWFWADTRQQLPGLSLALMALLLAMAANVGVSTMVSSFRLTFTDFLDQRLASELYVNAENAQQADQIISILEPRVDAVLPIQSTRTIVFDQPTEVYGARVHRTQTENWTFLAAQTDPWQSVQNGNGILINEQLARRTNSWVGASALVNGTVFDVVGVYGDYGNPIGQAIIDETQYAAIFKTEAPMQFGIRTNENSVPELIEELQSEFGLGLDQLVDQASIKAFSLGIFERTFAVTGALNILTLAVAGFAILMSLLTLAGMRTPQLAPVWALGITRRRLGWLELLRAVVLAIVTTLLAIPLGLALAWVLLAIVNVAAFGWKLPMFFFPADYLRLAGFALVAACLAALWPAIRLSRTPPAALLKVFANER